MVFDFSECTWVWVWLSASCGMKYIHEFEFGSVVIQEENVYIYLYIYTHISLQVLPIWWSLWNCQAAKGFSLGWKNWATQCSSFGKVNSTNSLDDLVNHSYLPTMYFISLQNIQPAVVAANGFSMYVKDLQPFFHCHSLSCLKWANTRMPWKLNLCWVAWLCYRRSAFGEFLAQ